LPKPRTAERWGLRDMTRLTASDQNVIFDAPLTSAMENVLTLNYTGHSMIRQARGMVAKKLRFSLYTS